MITRKIEMKFMQTQKQSCLANPGDMIEKETMLNELFSIMCLVEFFIPFYSLLLTLGRVISQHNFRLLVESVKLSSFTCFISWTMVVSSCRNFLLTHHALRNRFQFLLRMKTDEGDLAHQ